MIDHRTRILPTNSSVVVVPEFGKSRTVSLFGFNKGGKVGDKDGWWPGHAVHSHAAPAGPRLAGTAPACGAARAARKRNRSRGPVL